MLKVNGVTVAMVRTNLTGSKCIDIDVVQNGHKVRVFSCQVDVEIAGNRSDNIRGMIDWYRKHDAAKYGSVKRWIFHNRHYHGYLATGNLSGYDVTLYNHRGGLITGINNSGTALEVTSTMKLINEGGIYGAGGKGGTGGHGKTQSGTEPTGHYVTIYTEIPSRYYQNPAGHHVPAGTGWQQQGSNGVSMTRQYRPGISVYYNNLLGMARNNSKVAVAPTGLPSSRPVVNLRIVRGTHRFDNLNGMHWGYYDAIVQKSPMHTFHHAGGTATAGGDGIWWKHNAIGRQTGHRGAGGTFNAGYGGHGGTWGTAGEHGGNGQGGKGAGLGAVGGRGGYAIHGKTHLILPKHSYGTTKGGVV